MPEGVFRVAYEDLNVVGRGGIRKESKRIMYQVGGSGEHCLVRFLAGLRYGGPLAVHYDAALDGAVEPSFLNASELVKNWLPPYVADELIVGGEFGNPSITDVAFDDLESLRIILDPTVVGEGVGVGGECIDAKWRFGLDGLKYAVKLEVDRNPGRGAVKEPTSCIGSRVVGPRSPSMKQVRLKVYNRIGTTNGL